MLLWSDIVLEMDFKDMSYESIGPLENLRLEEFTNGLHLY